MKKLFYTLALLMVLMGLRLEAQHRPAELRFHVGPGAFYDASKQLSVGTSYRHYFGKRGWAIEPEYSLMTERGHQDHMLVLNAVIGLQGRRCFICSWERESIFTGLTCWS